MKPTSIVKSLLDDAGDEVPPKHYIEQLPDTRQVTVQVTLTFDESIQDVEQVVNNIHEALVLQYQGNGLAPGQEDVVTKRIQVKLLNNKESIEIDDSDF